jgi:hypothetical protein
MAGLDVNTTTVATGKVQRTLWIGCNQNATIVRLSIRVLTMLTVRGIAPDGSSIAIDTGTRVTTHMSFPLGSYPVPAVMAEGWDWGRAPDWDPKKSAEAAGCFCALHYGGYDAIEGHNLGAHAYNGYRVTDGCGAIDDGSVEQREWRLAEISSLQI